MTKQALDNLIRRMKRNRLRETMFDRWHYVDQCELKGKGITARWLINQLDADGYRVTTGYGITGVWGYHDHFILWR